MASGVVRKFFRQCEFGYNSRMSEKTPSASSAERKQTEARAAPVREQEEAGQPTAVDLFCGCGGMSAGLRLAGFKILAGADFDRKHISSFTRNFPEAKSVVADLTALSPERFMSKWLPGVARVDLLAGGPPCQGFSKNVPRKLRRAEDRRNQLVATFLDYCEVLRPRLALMENVAEISNGFDRAFSQELTRRLSALGYSVASCTLNAAEYGVPQRRRRAFFLAAAGRFPPSAPAPTHSLRDSCLSMLRPAVSVWEAIGDLPSMSHDAAVAERREYACPPFSRFQQWARNGEARVKNHSPRRLSDKQYLRLASLQPGQSHKDLAAALKINGGYSGAYGRLTKDMVAPTITRWVFHPGSGRWGHPVDARVITMREAARLQGFPDEFEFVGSYNEQAGQIGNAVPPLLAKVIASRMLSRL